MRTLSVVSTWCCRALLGGSSEVLCSRTESFTWIAAFVFLFNMHFSMCDAGVTQVAWSWWCAHGTVRTMLCPCVSVQRVGQCVTFSAPGGSCMNLLGHLCMSKLGVTKTSLCFCCSWIEPPGDQQPWAAAVPVGGTTVLSPLV